MQIPTATTLSLADLEAYDATPRVSGVERRFLCPFCGDSKPRNTAHRSMAANVDTGAFICQRCKAKGKLTDFWTNNALRFPSQRARGAKLRRAFAVPPINSGVALGDTCDESWRERVANLVPLDSPQAVEGACYLEGRGIPLAVAMLSGAMFSLSWYGHRAVIFPLYDEAGNLCAAQGREIFGSKKLIAGPKKNGIFTAHAIGQGGEVLHAIDGQRRVIVTEAPIDALSLAACGFPAIALCGTSGPEWLHRRLLWRVVLATDDDAAGDDAETVLRGDLTPFGARCERWRPFGLKDWNEALQAFGAVALRAMLRLRNYERLSRAGNKSGAHLLALHSYAERCAGRRLDLTGQPIANPPHFDAGKAYRDAQRRES